MPKFTANQISAALTVAIASLCYTQEKMKVESINLESLEPDHFAPDETVGIEEVEQAIKILNSAFDIHSLKPNETFPDDPALPGVGAQGWLNAAFNSFEEDETEEKPDAQITICVADPERVPVIMAELAAIGIDKIGRAHV
jgi:hypothetical protein